MRFGILLCLHSALVWAQLLWVQKYLWFWYWDIAVNFSLFWLFHQCFCLRSMYDLQFVCWLKQGQEFLKLGRNFLFPCIQVVFVLSDIVCHLNVQGLFVIEYCAEVSIRLMWPFISPTSSTGTEMELAFNSTASNPKFGCQATQVTILKHHNALTQWYQEWKG